MGDPSIVFLFCDPTKENALYTSVLE